MRSPAIIELKSFNLQREISQLSPRTMATFAVEGYECCMCLWPRSTPDKIAVFLSRWQRWDRQTTGDVEVYHPTTAVQPHSFWAGDDMICACPLIIFYYKWRLLWTIYVFFSSLSLIYLLEFIIIYHLLCVPVCNFGLILC